MTFHFHMRLAWAAGLAAVFAALPLTAASAKTPTPEGIMRAEENLTYAGLLMINGVQKVKILHGEGQRQRQEFLGANGDVSDLLISNGQIRWHYSPRAKLVRVGPIEQSAGLDKRLKLLARNYRFQLMGEGFRADRAVELVRFVPRHHGNLVHMLWVDKATNLPLAVERRQEDGKLVDRSEYMHIAFNPRLAESAFSFQIPTGCRVFSATTVLAHGDAAMPVPADVRFRPTLPKILPQGYAYMRWMLFSDRHQVPTFSWRFNDGLNPLSLFAVEERYQAKLPAEAQPIALGGTKGYLVLHGADRLFTWTAHGTNYTLVGNLPETEFEAVAKSTL